MRWCLVAGDDERAGGSKSAMQILDRMAESGAQERADLERREAELAARHGHNGIRLETVAEHNYGNGLKIVSRKIVGYGPKRGGCPACNKPSVYARDEDRYYHLDGSDSVPCQIAIASGQTDDDDDGDADVDNTVPGGNVNGQASSWSPTYTDTANAQALADKHAHRLRYVPEIGVWIRWADTHWQTEPDTGAVDTAASEIAKAFTAVPSNKAAVAHKKRSLSRAGITDMVRLARSNPAMRVSREVLDANGYELNTPSGIVDLRTGHQTPHRADAWHTKMAGVAYDRDADCPLWEAFLTYTFSDNTDLIDYVQKLAGCAAIGAVIHHILPFCFGSGQNGKTILLEVLSRALGDYAITSPANFLLAGHNEHATEIARLAGARLVVCSEINEGTKFDEAKVKLLTGGDKLTGRLMRQDYWDFRPSHTLFLMGNHQPAVGAGGDAFWRRVRLIPFTNRVPDDKKVENLDLKLIEAEGPAILAWIVRGAIAVANHALTEPEVVLTATTEYAESEDHLQQFIDEATRTVSDDFKLPSGQVYRRYASWCQDNGITPKAAGVFGRSMSVHGFGTIKSHGRRFITGVMLLDDHDNSAE